MTEISKPKVFGPGVWWAIHSMAYRARDANKKIEFRNFMHTMRDTLPCIDCRKHCTEYILENPIEKWFYYNDEDTGEPIGCFYWAWRFHNTVNARLGKNPMSWEDAIKMHGVSSEVCAGDCDDDHGEVIETKKKFRLVSL